VILRARSGIGRRQWPTPRGEFYVRSRLEGYGQAGSAYGPVAFGTSARSSKLTDWPGGGIVGIHGTNQPRLIPGRSLPRLRATSQPRRSAPRAADAGRHARDHPVGQAQRPTRSDSVLRILRTKVRPANSRSTRARATASASITYWSLLDPFPDLVHAGLSSLRGPGADRSSVIEGRVSIAHVTGRASARTTTGRMGSPPDIHAPESGYAAATPRGCDFTSRAKTTMRCAAE
jgi:hypothetical protein